MIIICAMTNKSNINDEKRDGEYESLQMLRSKNDGPLRANFRRIKQGGHPQNSYYMKILAEYRFFSRPCFAG